MLRSLAAGARRVRAPGARPLSSGAAPEAGDFSMSLSSEQRAMQGMARAFAKAEMIPKARGVAAARSAPAGGGGCGDRERRLARVHAPSSSLVAPCVAATRERHSPVLPHTTHATLYTHARA